MKNGSITQRNKERKALQQSNAIKRSYKSGAFRFADARQAHPRLKTFLEGCHNGANCVHGHIKDRWTEAGKLIMIVSTKGFQSRTFRVMEFNKAGEFNILSTHNGHPGALSALQQA